MNENRKFISKLPSFQQYVMEVKLPVDGTREPPSYIQKLGAITPVKFRIPEWVRFDNRWEVTIEKTNMPAANA